MGISDIAIGGTIASEEMYSFFGASAPYLQDDMVSAYIHYLFIASIRLVIFIIRL